jgi:hypothetical protein
MLCALMALAIRAIAPAGVLLAPDADRWVALTLCRGAGAAMAALNLETGEVREDGAPAAPENGAEAHAPCLCAAHAAVAPAPAAGGLSSRIASLRAAPIPKTACAPGRGIAAPPPWATGPPSALL